VTTSAIMRKCRSGNATELRFRRQLRRALGPDVRFEARGLPGTPDAVVDRAKVAVFMHGCFWHGCPKCYKAPRRNRRFWAAKLSRNRARDRRVVAQLRRAGWLVVILWECDFNEVGTTVVVRMVRSRSA